MNERGAFRQSQEKCKNDEEWSRSIYNTQNNQRCILAPEEQDEDDLNRLLEF